MSKKHTYEYVKEVVENLEYVLISKEYKNSHQKLILKDIEGYYYEITFANLCTGNSPLRFDVHNTYTLINIELWCKLNDKSFKLISKEYKNARCKLKWQCLKENCGEIFEITWGDVFSNNCGCGYCAGKQVGLSNCLATKNPELAKQWHPTLNGKLTPWDVTCASNKNVWWQCEKGHKWKTTIEKRNNRQDKCPYCAGKLPSKDYNLLVCNPELCKDWNYKKNNKRPEEYCPNSNQKVWWICKECGWEWKAQISDRNNGNGCPNCNKSKGENIIQNFLDLYNIFYDREYDKFIDLISDKGNPLRFDFVIFEDKEKTKIKQIIEYDGEYHFKVIKYKNESMKMAKYKFKTQQYHDKLKNEYCIKNNISLLRIPYWKFDNIEEILIKELNLNDIKLAI